MAIVKWMEKKRGAPYNGILFSHEKEQKNSIWSNMDGPRDYHTKWNKSDRERQMSNDSTYMWNLKKWYKLNSKTEINSPTQKTNL